MATFIPVVIVPNEPIPPGFRPPPGYVLDISKAVALWKSTEEEYEVVLDHDDLKAAERSYFPAGLTVKSIRVKAGDINMALL